MKKKCHNCKGYGIVMSAKAKRKGECYYCRGKGWRDAKRGRDYSGAKQ